VGDHLRRGGFFSGEECGLESGEEGGGMLVVAGDKEAKDADGGRQEACGTRGIHNRRLRNIHILLVQKNANYYC
jgi:hypothetical protein